MLIHEELIEVLVNIINNKAEFEMGKNKCIWSVRWEARGFESSPFFSPLVAEDGTPNQP